MKKFFGIVLAIVGFVLGSCGTAIAMVAVVRRESAMTFRNIDPSHYDDQQLLGVSLIVVAVLMLFAGIIMTAIKTNHQRETELELKLLKDSLSSAYINEDPFHYIEKLGKLRQQGLLSEEEFQVLKSKALGTF